MKKRAFAILLTCMTLGALSGCAGNAAAPASTAANTAAAETGTTAATETETTAAAETSAEAAETESTAAAEAAAPDSAEAAAPDSADIDYATGTPWLCSMIDGIVTKDTPADPKDDF